MSKKNTLILVAGLFCISLGAASIFLALNDTIAGALMGMGIGLLLFNLNRIGKQKRA